VFIQGSWAAGKIDDSMILAYLRRMASNGGSSGDFDDRSYRQLADKTERIKVGVQNMVNDLNYCVANATTIFNKAH
jgi:hypothetical protein